MQPPDEAPVSTNHDSMYYRRQLQEISADRNCRRRCSQCHRLRTKRDIDGPRSFRQKWATKRLSLVPFTGRLGCRHPSRFTTVGRRKHPLWGGMIVQELEQGNLRPKYANSFRQLRSSWVVCSKVWAETYLHAPQFGLAITAWYGGACPPSLRVDRGLLTYAIMPPDDLNSAFRPEGPNRESSIASRSRSLPRRH